MKTTVASDLDMASTIGNIDANALSSVGTRFIEDSDTAGAAAQPNAAFTSRDRAPISLSSTDDAVSISYTTPTMCELIESEPNIAYWKEFVSQYYVPGARKRWCMSSYEKIGDHSLSIISGIARETRHCGICGSNSWKGVESNFEVLPRLLKTQFESGVIDELLYLNFPREFRLPSGLMVLIYEKAVEESVYEQFRVVRDGQLRILFRHDFKILSWDFCARHHEVFVARSSIALKVNQLVQTADKYTRIVAATVDSRMSPQDLLSDCNRFVMEGQRLTRSLELLLVNDLGFSKSFVRCLQTAEVVKSMKDLMQFSHCNNIGAIESLQRYCQRGDPTTNHPTKKIYNAVEVPPTGMDKSISGSTRNKRKRHMPNQSSCGKCPRRSSPSLRKVQGSPLRGFLISQLSQTDHKTAKLEVKEEVFEEIDRNAATDPPAYANGRLLQMPAASSSYYPPHLFNAMELQAILSMDKEDGILENDSPNEAET